MFFPIVHLSSLNSNGKKNSINMKSKIIAVVITPYPNANKLRLFTGAVANSKGENIRRKNVTINPLRNAFRICFLNELSLGKG